MKKELNPFATLAVVTSIAGWLAMIIVAIIRQTAYQDQPLYAIPALFLILSVVFGIKGKNSEYRGVAHFGIWLTIIPFCLFVIGSVLLNWK